MIPTLSERMAELMAATGWTITQMAEIAGVSHSAVSQWKDGTTRSIKIEPATKLAAKSGFNPIYLALGKGEKRSALAESPDSDTIEDAGRPRAGRRVPIIGTAKLGKDGFYEEISGGDGHIEIATQDKDAFCLRVRGQSMFPAIRDGWYVLVEPNGRPRTGEYVLVKLRDGQRMVKELLNQRSTGSIEVMSINGSERLTFDKPEIEAVLAVGAVVSPSKYMPD